MAGVPRCLGFLTPNRWLPSVSTLADSTFSAPLATSFSVESFNEANTFSSRGLATRTQSNFTSEESSAHLFHRDGESRLASPSHFCRHYSSAVPRRRVKEGEPRLKNDALDIYFAGLEAVEPKRAVDNVLSRQGDILRCGL